MDLKVYRPQEVQDAIEWTLTREERVIPQQEVDEKKVGIRVNGDGDDDGDENDLIEIEVATSIPEGFDLVIKRTDSDLSVYADKNATNTILGSASEAVVEDQFLPPASYWVEAKDAVTNGAIEFYYRAKAGASENKVRTIPFRTFTSVVTSLSGETGFGSDPLTHGIYDISVDLYKKGYNIHYYDEGNEDRCITEINEQRNECDVNICAIFGYSHGGGSTYRVANAVKDRLIILFTGYVDAVTNRFQFTFESEERRPPGSGAFHFNYYQTNGFLNGEPSIPSANVEKDLTATTDHGSIDNDPGVIKDLTSHLESRVLPKIP